MQVTIFSVLKTLNVTIPWPVWKEIFEFRACVFYFDFQFTFHLLALHSVCFYPIKMRRHTGVDSWVVSEGTAHCPRNETNEFSLDGQGATRVTLWEKKESSFQERS